MSITSDCPTLKYYSSQVCEVLGLHVQKDIFQTKIKASIQTLWEIKHLNAETTTLKNTSQLLGGNGDSTQFPSSLISLDMKISTSEVLHNVKVLIL